MVLIERKGLEQKRLNDFAKYIIISNHNTLLKIDIGDFCVVCFDISVHCRENTKYFKRLENIFDHSDVFEVVIKYLLNYNLLDFEL